MSSPRGCPGVPGSSYRQVMVPRDTGGTTGPGSPSATPAPDTGTCRRNRSTGELAFYNRYSPQRVTLATLVKVAGLRWTIEENFQACKGLTGLDEHQVRRNEIAHLLAAVTAPPGRDAGHRLRWSHWRRRHQHRARTRHHQRQITQDHAT